MPILHKFHKTNWNNGFATHGAILDITPYEPEVLFLGTYDPGIPGNEADFFYSGNFFWTGFKNLFVKNAVAITRRRGYAKPINPTLDEIFGLCKQLKLTFADLIPGVLHNNNPTFHLLPKNRVYVAEYNIRLIAEHNLSLINDTDLKQLDYIGQVNWNTKNIIDFLCKHPTIKTVYFTRRPTGIWQPHWDAIANHKCMEGRTLTNIYSPSGLGRPIFHSMTRLLNSWVHNSNLDFGRLENDWLTAHGVNLNNF